MLGRISGWAVLWSLLLFHPWLVAEPFIQVVGLFKNKAVLKIDGMQRILSAGERSPEGIVLISSDSKQAIIETNGKRQTLSLSREINSGFAVPETKQVSIRKNARSEYLVSGSINNHSSVFLVDTGANLVAMSSNRAQALGIDYLENGIPGQVVTASGVQDSYTLLLDKVEVGGIAIHHVEATIILGSYPRHVLLGMSYLQHVGMRESNGIMYLEQKLQ